MIIALVQISLVMVMSQVTANGTGHVTQRYRWALVGILGAWILLFIGASSPALTGQNPIMHLPPLERAVTAISITLICWAFVVADRAERSRVADIIVLLVIGFILIAYTITGVDWINVAASTDFNLSIYGLLWALISLAVCVFGALVILRSSRRVLDTPLKLLFFLILILGYGFSLSSIARGELIGNFAGPERLAFFVALIILPVALHRSTINQIQQNTEEAITLLREEAKTSKAAAVSPQSSRPEASESRPVSPIETQPILLLKALGMILETPALDRIPQYIVSTAVDMLRADIGALLRIQDANYADITYTYNKVLNKAPSGLALNLDDQPTLVNAIERRNQRALYPDRNIEELTDLYTRLDIDQYGPIYFQPLVRGGEVMAVILVGLPYSERELTASEQELLKGMAIISATLLGLTFDAHEASILAQDRAIQSIVESGAATIEENISARSTSELQSSLELARDQITQLSRQVMELKIKLDDERSRFVSLLGSSEEELSISQAIVAINSEQQLLREERDRLQRRLQEAETVINGATEPNHVTALNNMIESLHNEHAALQAERDRLLSEIEAMQKPDADTMPLSELQHIVNRMLNERSDLETERDQLTDKLNYLLKHLNQLGFVSGDAGITQLIEQLAQERLKLQAQNLTLQTERDTLLSERTQLNSAIENEKQRDARMHMLQTQLENLAADREAALKNRDRLRADLDEMEAKLNTVKEHRARLLAQVAGMELELNEAHEEQSRLRSQIQEIANIQSSEQANNMIKQLRQDILDLSSQKEQLQNRIQITRQDLTRLDRSISQPDATSGSTQYSDLLVGLVQELRTPMTSITGYIDLLLVESAGILGEMQRKFLQRVSANVSRLDTMINDLVKVTELDAGHFELSPMPVDVVNIIEDAITNASMQFREKGLAVTLDLDDTVPLLQADKDAITQIIGQLLTNAYLVSPPDTEIIIQTRVESVVFAENQMPRESIHVSIEDRGGGIQADDIPRVFARKYKAENPLISGLGDTGVGLSIAKALVEAHQGRLWVETRQGLGSIFSFALPLDIAPEHSEG